MNSNKLKTTLLFILIIVIGISSALVLYFYQNFHRSEHYLPGVKIACLSMQGYTIDEAVEKINENLDVFLDTPVTFFYNDYNYVTELKEICLVPSVQKIIDEIWAQEQERDICSKIINLDGSKPILYPIKVEYDPDKIGEMVEEWNKSLATEYVNARLEIDQQKGLIIIPGLSGLKIDVDKTLEGLPQEYILNQEQSEINLPVVVQEQQPLITDIDLQNMGEIATYNSWYNTGEVDRSHNVRLASNSINGTAILPGESFSFNNIVGQRNYQNGYRDALIIIGGLFEPGLGGGICQVSSTLYNTALLAGMDIIERHNHTLAVAYVPLGRDATIAYGLQDLKFRNNTNYPIYIRSIAQGGKLTINIYGDMNYKQRIKIGHIVDKVIDYNEVIKTDDTLEPGSEKVVSNGTPGYIVRSFRTFYDQDGNEVKNQRLATDKYAPLNKVILLGPKLVDKPIDELLQDNDEESDEEIKKSELSEKEVKNTEGFVEPESQDLY
ncbi:MAG TPA: VanW family protein [Syntrophomonadaceae bacterium]|nr:VanW family protein [Syntrophomonadaceae bacterium]